jgi:hypothetical protein
MSITPGLASFSIAPYAIPDAIMLARDLTP